MIYYSLCRIKYVRDSFLELFYLATLIHSPEFLQKNEFLKVIEKNYW